MLTETRVLVFPAWTDNPYLNLLSLAPSANGFEFLGSTSWRGLVGQSARLSRGDILHLHWTSPLVQSVESESGADARLVEVIDLLDDLRDRGVRLVWTVHNRLPHELNHRTQEITLFQAIADRADVIHIMSPATPEVLAETCILPSERVRMIPHPSYQGVYGGPPRRFESRQQLGLGEDEVAVLFLGQMRPYKGIDLLLTAVGAAAAQNPSRPLVLLLAGSASDEARAELERMMPSGVRAITRFEFVPDAEVGQWFAAADVAVFPYRAILNSGSVHLAATYDVPVILPGETHLRDEFRTQTWVSFFDTEDPVASLTEKIAQVPPRSGKPAHGFEDFNRQRSPWAISTLYLDLLRGLSSADLDVAVR